MLRLSSGAPCQCGISRGETPDDERDFDECVEQTGPAVLVLRRLRPRLLLRLRDCPDLSLGARERSRRSVAWRTDVRLFARPQKGSGARGIPARQPDERRAHTHRKAAIGKASRAQR
jgi:hypothetical protein